MALQLGTLAANAAITAIYIGYYNRAPDPEGLNYWIGRYTDPVDPMTLSEIAASFSVQVETKAAYPFLAAPNVAQSVSFLQNVYDFLFNRIPPQGDAGLTYWVDKLEANPDPQNVGQIIIDIISGAQDTDAPDRATVLNKIAVGTDFAQTLSNTNVQTFSPTLNPQAYNLAHSILQPVDQTQATVNTAMQIIDDYEANPDTVAVAGDTFALTPVGGGASNGQDIIDGTAGDDDFLANAGNALDSTDVLDGMAGTDLLDIGAMGLDNGALPSLTSIERINNASANRTFDLGNTSGTNQIWSDGSGGVYTYLNAEFSTIFGASGDTGVGKVVDIDFEGSTAGMTEVTFAVDDVNGNGVFFQGPDSPDIEIVNLMAMGESGPGMTGDEVNDRVDLFFFTDIKTLNITGLGDLDVFTVRPTIESIAAMSATGDLVFSNSGPISPTDLATVDLGSGDDDIWLDITTNDVPLSVDLGAGDDMLRLDIFGPTADDVAAVIALGAGSDTIIFNNLSNISDVNEIPDDLIRVTDFNGSDDVADLSNLFSAQTVLTNAELAAVEGSANLTAAATAAGNLLAAAGDFVIFDFDGSAYLLFDFDGGQSFTASDGLVEFDGFSESGFNASNLVF